MQDILLSIIVPIYNVESFLRKCVESLEDQDIAQDRYEVILINDGSTDRSGNICRELAEQYANIRLIEQENQGVSAARNAGIDAAQGKYLMFVDSDDWIEPDMLEALCDEAKKADADMVICDYYEHKSDEVKLVTQQPQSCTANSVLSEILMGSMGGGSVEQTHTAKSF